MFNNHINNEGHVAGCDAQHTPGEHVKPEWVRPNQVAKIFGIGRTKLYDLISRGKIKSVSLKERGTTRGTRLISYDSLVEFIEKHIDGKDAAS